MAIQVNIENSQFGVPFAGAYFRIVGVNVCRENVDHKHMVKLDISGYATRPENENTREVDFRRYHATLAEVETQAGDSFLAKCYAWLMQQPDMVGSIGV